MEKDRLQSVFIDVARIRVNVHETIGGLIERGERLSKLASRSQELSTFGSEMYSRSDSLLRRSRKLLLIRFLLALLALAALAFLCNLNSVDEKQFTLFAIETTNATRV